MMRRAAEEDRKLDPTCIDLPLGLSRWGWGECPRPRISAALRLFDPTLIFVWDKQYECHVLLKTVERKVHYKGLVWFEYPVWHILNWPKAMLGDNPEELIAHLRACDVYEHPELENAADEAIEEHKRDADRKSKDMFHHAFRENRRLLAKAWEPVMNFPASVR